MQMEFLSKNKKHAKRAGRPVFKPTRRTREQVEIAIAGGLSASEVASVVGISRSTLERHFADELKNGRVRKLAHVLCLLERAAKRGSVSAMKFLLTVFSNGTTARLGKKEATQRAAENVVADDTVWGDDLQPGKLQ
jgi:AcrR family transcriptional regulator